MLAHDDVYDELEWCFWIAAAFSGALVGLVGKN
jgi:hypothetical protein